MGGRGEHNGAKLREEASMMMMMAIFNSLTCERFLMMRMRVMSQEAALSLAQDKLQQSDPSCGCDHRCSSYEGEADERESKFHRETIRQSNSTRALPVESKQGALPCHVTSRHIFTRERERDSCCCGHGASPSLSS